MFQEKDEGKPKRWGYLIAVFVTVTAFNICVVITIRALLDSEDEVNVPIIQGDLRENLTYFLGIFTMTFFFGCCCCFCCACSCCKWCFYNVPGGISRVWSGIPNLFVNNLDQFPIHRFRERNEDYPQQDDVVEKAKGILSTKLEKKRSDRCAYENNGYFDVVEMDNVNSPRLILPPLSIGRKRSHSIDITSIV